MRQLLRYPDSRHLLLAGLLAAGLSSPALAEDAAATPPKPAATTAAKPAPAQKPAASTSQTPATTQATEKAATARRSPYQPDRFAGRARKYYELVWGVDSLNVKLMESGEVVRFTYRVLDPDRAQVLNSRATEPALFDARAGVKLVVPKMEKIGQLRQTSPPEVGKAYWMVFSNKGRPVKKGDRVDVVIGQFRAPGLVVD